MFQELGMFSDSIGMFSSDVNPLPAPSLNLDFTTGTLDSRITYTRAQAVANTVTYTGSNGLIQYATANTARFDYNPTTLAANGLLIEESRANLLTYSSDYTQTVWVKTSATITSFATTSPDGTVTAQKIVEGSGSVTPQILLNTNTSLKTQESLSIYAKDAGRRYLVLGSNTSDNSPAYAIFDLQLGIAKALSGGSTKLSSFSIVSVGNGWYRCNAITTTTVGSTAFRFIAATANTYSPTYNSLTTPVAAYTGDGTSGIYLWGAQLETGAFATSLIQTTTTSITRNADNASMTGANFNSWFNANQGTLVSIAIPYNVSAISGGFVVSDGTANNTIETAHGSTPRAFINTGGVTQLSQSNGFVVANSIVKAAISYQENNANGACNGVAGTAVLSCLIPTVNKAIIGNVYDGSSALNGTISKIIAYTVRLPDNTLKGLTS